MQSGSVGNINSGVLIKSEKLGESFKVKKIDTTLNKIYFKSPDNFQNLGDPSLVLR